MQHKNQVDPSEINQAEMDENRSIDFEDLGGHFGFERGL